MTTACLTPQWQFFGYQLSPNLREDIPVRRVRSAPPNESKREELLILKLGAKGWGRLHHFRNYYSAGWGEGFGKPLSPRALENFYRFLESVSFPAGSTPSVFLTDDGNLEVCWEDLDNKAVHVEFGASEIEYYVEAKEEEKSIASTYAKDLAVELSTC